LRSGATTSVDGRKHGQRNPFFVASNRLSHPSFFPTAVEAEKIKGGKALPRQILNWRLPTAAVGFSYRSLRLVGISPVVSAGLTPNRRAPNSKHSDTI